MTVHVKIEGEAAENLNRLVAGGRYASHEEVIAEALSLVHAREEQRAIAEGLADVDAGRVTPLDRVRTEMHERYGGRAR